MAETPAEAVGRARNLWLSADGPESAVEIERLYRSALTSSYQSQRHHPSTDGRHHPSTDGHGDRPTKKARKEDSLTDEEYFQAGERLALLLCQSGRCSKAKKGLSSLGFTCRLSEKVLDYQSSSETNGQLQQEKSVPCQIIDNFLPEPWLKRLGRVFMNPDANYWTYHNYSVEPPSPYFSYILPLGEELKSFGFIGKLIERITNCPLIAEKFPKIRNATAAEMWAHNRPHGSGHQMHFDSDDEGRGGVRNPIISCILYISEDDCNIPGGPSLVTNQKLSSVRLASRGWLAHPKARRLVVFDGRYLHGVVPGKLGESRPGRRVTLMLAFWEKIEVRNSGSGPGSARKFPESIDKTVAWAESLQSPYGGGDMSYEACKETSPVELDRVYETLDGKKWNGRMPDYDCCFQGF